MNKQDENPSMNIKDFENLIKISNSSFNDVKQYIEICDPDQDDISKKIQMRIIEIRDHIITKLKKSGIYSEYVQPQDQFKKTFEID